MLGFNLKAKAEKQIARHTTSGCACRCWRCQEAHDVIALFDRAKLTHGTCQNCRHDMDRPACSQGIVVLFGPGYAGKLKGEDRRSPEFGCVLYERRL